METRNFSSSLFSKDSRPGRSRHGLGGDRFIPTRSAMNLDIASFNLQEISPNSDPKSGILSFIQQEYKRNLIKNLFQHEENIDSKIFAFRTKNGATALRAKHCPTSHDLHPWDEKPLYSSKTYRHIPLVPDRVLDAPELVDDYYLNLLDWSCKNVIAIALGTTVYLWHADSGAIHQLMGTLDEDNYVTSVAWAPNGEHIALGFNNKEIQMWDATQCSQMRTLRVHSDRVGSLAWNTSTLSSGGRDSKIFNHDMRIRNQLISEFMGHNQEVCGLKWAPSGQLLASGGNDNLLHVWDSTFTSSSRRNSARQVSTTPYLYRLDEHQAAVKALAWCPFQYNLLVSGGGTTDCCIKFWNTHTGSCIKSVDTGSQVCALQWNHHHKEVLSSHGFSQNQLCIWKYPSMTKMAELVGHTARVLHLAQSPDGTTVVSAAADETLRFWKVFGPPPLARKAWGILCPEYHQIR